MPEIPEYNAPAGALKIDLSLKHQGDQMIERAAEQTRQSARVAQQLGRQSGEDLQRGFNALGSGLGGIAAGLKQLEAHQGVDEVSSQIRLQSNWSVQTQKDYQTQVQGADASDTNAGQNFTQKKIDEINAMPVPTTPQGKEQFERWRATTIEHLQHQTILADGERVGANAAMASQASVNAAISRIKGDPTDAGFSAVMTDQKNAQDAHYKAMRAAGVPVESIIKLRSEDLKSDAKILSTGIEERLVRAMTSSDPDAAFAHFEKEIPDIVKKYGEQTGLGGSDLIEAMQGYKKQAAVAGQAKIHDAEVAQGKVDTAFHDKIFDTIMGQSGDTGTPENLTQAHKILIDAARMPAGPNKPSREVVQQMLGGVERSMNKEFKEDPALPGQLGRAIDEGSITSESQLWQYVGRPEGGITINTEKTLAASLGKSTQFIDTQKDFMAGYKAKFADAAKDEMNPDGSMRGPSAGTFARFKYQADQIVADARKAGISDKQIWNPDGAVVKQLDALSDRMAKSLKPGGGITEAPLPGAVSTPRGKARESMNGIATKYFASGGTLGLGKPTEGQLKNPGGSTVPAGSAASYGLGGSDR